MRRRLKLAALAWCFAIPAWAQDSPAGRLPAGDLFAPLVADPKQPKFFASYLHTSSRELTGWVGNVGLGATIGLWRGGSWQVGLGVGVFSQFDMDTPSNDLINTDFVGGIPLSWRRGVWSGRLRAYHQSSHLGDEYVIQHQPVRVNLSYEALELLVARDLGPVRLYGGGEYLYRRDPADLRPGVLHAGLDLLAGRAGLRLPLLGEASFSAGLDVKAPEECDWRPGTAARAGLEVAGPGGRTIGLQMHFYRGPAPYGQFYQENVSAFGAGLHFSL